MIFRYPAVVAARLDDNSIPCPASGCILWTRKLNAKGYGRLEVDGRERMAHRVTWALARGPFAASLCVCHKCDVRACINPEHLFLGTKGDNNRDMMAKGRHSHGARHTGAKLTDAEVIAIRLDARGPSAVGRDYGINSTTVREIRNGEIWRHLPMPEATPSNFPTL